MLLLLHDEYFHHHVFPFLRLRDLVKIDFATRGNPMADRIKDVFTNYVLQEEHLRLPGPCLPWLCMHHVYARTVCVESCIPSQYLGIFSRTVSLKAMSIPCDNIQSILSNCHKLECFESRNLDQRIVASLIENCPALQGLQLNYAAIDQEALLVLSRAFPNMLKLTLAPGGDGLTDNIVKEICMNCRRLIELDLSKCYDLSDAAMMAIAQFCPLIRRLYLSKLHAITDAGVNVLFQALPALTDLELGSCSSLGDDAMLSIAQYCPLIQRLDLSGLHNITDAGASVLFQALPDLRILNVSNCTALASEAVLSLSRWCHKLTSVNLFRINDECIEASCVVTLIRSCVFLEQANLAFLRYMNDDVLNAFADSCPRLTQIVLTACVCITDAGLSNLVSKCLQLIEIGIGSCKKLTADSLYAIAANCPNLCRLYCWNLPNIHCDAILSVVRNCPRLQKFDFQRGSTLSKDDLDTIKKEASFCVNVYTRYS